MVAKGEAALATLLRPTHCARSPSERFSAPMATPLWKHNGTNMTTDFADTSIPCPLLRNYAGDALVTQVPTRQYTEADQQLHAYHRAQGHRCSEFGLWLNTQFSRWASSVGRRDIVRAAAEVIASARTAPAEHLRYHWVIAALGVSPVRGQVRCPAGPQSTTGKQGAEVPERSKPDIASIRHEELDDAAR